nr:MAG TPA: hypothetical protein [Caudoviricetes sp.]
MSNTNTNVSFQSVSSFMSFSFILTNFCLYQIQMFLRVYLRATWQKITYSIFKLC